MRRGACTDTRSPRAPLAWREDDVNTAHVRPRQDGVGGSPRSGIEGAQPALDVLGVGPDIPVVTRDQVPHAKPDPDLSLAAAERLNVDIEASVVVGDSVWDLLAARRARALGV